MKSNTIAAIATPMTNSGIGIIRISGDEALDIIEKVFKPKKKDKKIKDVKTYIQIREITFQHVKEIFCDR